MKNRPALLAGMSAALCAAFVCSNAFAQLPTSCAQLVTDAASPVWSGRAEIFSVTSTQATTGGRAYCNISIVWRDPALVGEGTVQGDGTLFPGYAPGGPPTPNSYQHVRMGFGLPLNTNTGTAAWSRRAVQTSGGGDQGSVAGFTGYVGMTNPSTGVDGIEGQAAIGLSTDSGHGTADSGTPQSYGFVQDRGPNYGKMKDWAGGRSYCTAIRLAKELALYYYGQPVLRTYWEGFSGGGQMGMTQMQNCPEEYDGAVPGAPSWHWQQFRLVDSWAQVVNKKANQLGAGITNAQRTSVASAAIQYCMSQGSGGFVGTTNILNDPRSCGYNAAWHVCGHPMAPATNCLIPGTRQAELFNQILHGPVNAHGMLVYYPYSHGVAISTSDQVATNTPAGGTGQVMRWNHFSNLTAAEVNAMLYSDQESLELGGSLAGALTFAQEMHLGTTRVSDFSDTNNPRIDAVKNRGIKIIQTHGTHDNLILFRQDPAYYRRVANYFYGWADYASLQSWYRLFLVPGLGHSAAAQLAQVVNWVENNQPPDRITALNRLACPYPQYAHWDGVGPTNNVNSFFCAGNLEDSWVARCSMVKTPYKQENQPVLDYQEMGIDPQGCPPSLNVQVVPSMLNMRTTAGVVTAVITSPDGRDLRDWGIADVSAMGAPAMSTAYSSDGRSMVVTFRKSGLASLPAGDKVWLTVIGSYNRDGESTRMQATTTVKVVR